MLDRQFVDLHCCYCPFDPPCTGSAPLELRPDVAELVFQFDFGVRPLALPLIALLLLAELLQVEDDDAVEDVHIDVGAE